MRRNNSSPHKKVAFSTDLVKIFPIKSVSKVGIQTPRVFKKQGKKRPYSRENLNSSFLRRKTSSRENFNSTSPVSSNYREKPAWNSSVRLGSKGQLLHINNFL